MPDIVSVSASVNLDDLATKIRNAMEEMTRNALRIGLDIGDYLALAKEQVSDGQWGHWLETNFKNNYRLSVRTAQLYMQCAAHRCEIEAFLETTPTLRLRDAAKLIAKPGKRKPGKSDEVSSGAEETDDKSPSSVAMVPAGTTEINEPGPDVPGDDRGQHRDHPDPDQADDPDMVAFKAKRAEYTIINGEKAKAEAPVVPPTSDAPAEPDHAAALLDAWEAAPARARAEFPATIDDPVEFVKAMSAGAQKEIELWMLDQLTIVDLKDAIKRKITDKTLKEVGPAWKKFERALTESDRKLSNMKVVH
jgi:hypothetical protein